MDSITSAMGEAGARGYMSRGLRRSRTPSGPSSIWRENGRPDKPIFLMGTQHGRADQRSLSYRPTGRVVRRCSFRTRRQGPGKHFTGHDPGRQDPLGPGAEGGPADPGRQAVSRDPAVVQAYINDPWSIPAKITARIGRRIAQDLAAGCCRSGKITLPILILQGGADRLVDPSGARLLYETVSSKDKAIKVYDGLYHEIFNEPVAHAGHELCGGMAGIARNDIEDGRDDQKCPKAGRTRNPSSSLS